MTNNQDALRCADELATGENFYYESSMSYDYILSEASANAAAHIRRLVEENEAKDALLRQAVEALEGYRKEINGLAAASIDPCDTEQAIRTYLTPKGATK